MNAKRRSKNPGYQQLLVWQDAIELYELAFGAVRGWPFEQKKLASQSFASSDSVHLNIAEGYCRRTIGEYLQHLNIALGSLGETLSGFIAYSRSGQIELSTFEQIDNLIFRLENRLLKLVASLERNRAPTIGLRRSSSAKTQPRMALTPPSPTTSVSFSMEW